MSWTPLEPPPAERDPRPVSASLGRFTSRLGLGRPQLMGAVFSRWEELVGPDVAAHARPRTLRDGVLTVVVDHPAWASSLRLLSGELLARLSAAGGEPIADLQLVVRPPRSAG